MFAHSEEVSTGRPAVFMGAYVQIARECYRGCLVANNAASQINRTDRTKRMEVFFVGRRNACELRRQVKSIGEWRRFGLIFNRA